MKTKKALQNNNKTYGREVLCLHTADTERRLPAVFHYGGVRWKERERKR